MKGGDIWYWVCQRCGGYKAHPSRTDLYCTFCKWMKKQEKS
jgi:hypothetical protein